MRAGLGCTQTPWERRGDSPAPCPVLIPQFPCSPQTKHTPQHLHLRSPCLKPTTNIPETPQHHLLLHLPALWDPKGGKKTKSSITSEGRLCTRCCESILFIQPCARTRPATQVRCKSQLPGLFLPNIHAPVAASSALPGFSRSCQELKWQLPAPGCNWENAPTQLRSSPGTHS